MYPLWARSVQPQKTHPDNLYWPMSNPLNPQAEQMADASMVQTLAFQAQAIWPQERPLFDRYALPAAPRILDIGCGTGEITSRLALHYPEADLLGLDILPGHIARARDRYAALAPRLHFDVGDAFALDAPDDAYDLTVCRHVLQSIPHPERVLAEMRRVTRPGGYLHVIAEDYAMIQFHPVATDTDVFWLDGPIAFGATTGTDLRVGRKAFTLLAELGIEDLTVAYVVVDTVRVPRETMIGIWEAWRDGYTEAIAQHTRFTRAEVLAYWADMLQCLRNPNGYAVWQVPVYAGRVV